MKPNNWVKIKQRRDHMRDISFPELAQEQIIDVLRSEHYHFMLPMKEIPGKEDKPSVRLCPLGCKDKSAAAKKQKVPQNISWAN